MARMDRRSWSSNGRSTTGSFPGTSPSREAPSTLPTRALAERWFGDAERGLARGRGPRAGRRGGAGRDVGGGRRCRPRSPARADRRRPTSARTTPARSRGGSRPSRCRFVSTLATTRRGWTSAADSACGRRRGGEGLVGVAALAVVGVGVRGGPVLLAHPLHDEGARGLSRCGRGAPAPDSRPVSPTTTSSVGCPRSVFYQD